MEIKAKPKKGGIRAYARHRDVRMSAVQKAIAQGRIKKSVVRTKDGHTKIDFALADKEWDANTLNTKPKPKPEAPAPERAPGAEEDWNEARTRHESLKADLAALRLEELQGRMVDVEDVRKEWFRLTRMVREAILNVPDRIAAQVAAEQDQHAVHQLLRGELVEALRELAKGDADGAEG